MELASLSSRGKEAQQPPVSYLNEFLQSRADPYHEEDNPDGYINFAVAENKLCSEMVHERITQAKPPQADVTAYNDFHGVERLRKAVANFFEHTFMTGTDVHKDEIAVGSGAGALVEAICFCICDEGDAMLIPAPLYPAFITDLERRSECKAVPVPEPDGATHPRSSTLKAELHNQKEVHGRHVRGLIVCNPVNPTGEVYDEAKVKELVEFASSAGLHILSDEIYACSVFDERASFTTTLKIADQVDPEWAKAHVHTVAGLSKDFCASGYRTGFMRTRNKSLIQSMANLAYFFGVSQDFQHRVADMLEDLQWVDAFIAKNRKALREAHGHCERALKAVGVDVVKASAGMFVWADFRRFLPEQTFEAESNLWRQLFDEAKVLVTPGKSCLASQPGFFRFCFATVARSALDTASHRLKRTLKQ